MKDKYRKAGSCSVNCFCWQSALVAKANRNKDYAFDDLALMSAEDDTHNLANKLEEAWGAEIIQAKRKKRKASILRAFCRAFSGRFLCHTFVGLLA